MFQNKRLKGGIVVCSMILFSLSVRAEQTTEENSQRLIAKVAKPWRARFEEISLASGKCKAAVDLVVDLFGTYEALSSKSEAEVTEKDSENLNTKFTTLMTQHLLDPQQACSKRVFIGYMIAAISLKVPAEHVEDTIQAVIGGFLNGSVSMLSARHEAHLLQRSFRQGLGPFAEFLVDSENLPDLPTYFNPQESKMLYINPRTSPSSLIKSVIVALQLQQEYFKQLNEREKGMAKKDRRLASF